MLKLRNTNARPRSSNPTPGYPRTIGLGLAVALAACGGQAVSEAQGEGGQGGEGGSGGELGGAMPPPYDAGTDVQDETLPQPPGAIAAPYDAGAEADAQPPPDGDIAPPFDAGEDAWVEPDAEVGGGAPMPFDAGEDALTGAAPAPFDGGEPW